MKISFKLLVGVISAMSLVAGASYSASAQTSSVDSVGNQTSGSSTPATERMGTTPGTTNDPSSRQQPDSTSRDGSSTPATERMGTTPGTTNDPSSRQQPSSTSRDGSMTPSTERMGTTPGTTNDPSSRQQPGSTSRDGSSTPSTERLGTNDPSNRQPGSTNRDGGMAPATERMGTTPGTTNDPSSRQQPGSTSRDGGMAPATERLGTTPGTTNDPSGSQRMMPQSRIEAPDSANSMSINAIVDESPSFELFNALLRVANIEDEGLVEMLDGEGSYVVYAPTDEAFAALPPDTIRTLVQPENRALLVELLSYHVVPEDATSSDSEVMENSDGVGQSAPATGEVDSPSQLSDSTSSFNANESSQYPRMRTDRASGSMMINDARVVGTNIEASNGTIYPIDRVILPSGVQSELGRLGLIPSTGTPNAITPGSNAPSQRPF